MDANNYYVAPDPGHAGKVMYRKGAWPTATTSDADNTDIGAVIEAWFADSGTKNDIELSSGTYSDTMLAADNTLFHNRLVTIKGSSEPGHDSDVVLTSTTSDIVSLGWRSSGFSGLEDITISGAIPGKSGLTSASGGKATLDNVRFKGNAKNIDTGVNSTEITCNRCLLGASSDESRNIYNGNASHIGKYNYCLFEGGETAAKVLLDGGTVTFANCGWIGFPGAAVQANAGTISFRNCWGIANAHGEAFFDYIVAPVGTTMDNCVMLPSPFDPADGVSGNITTTNLIEKSIKFRSKRRDSFVIMGIDDTGNLDHFEDVAGYAMDTYRHPMVFAGETSSFDAAKWAQAEALISNGHEIACHCRNQPALAELTGINIASTNTNTTINIDVPGNAITFFHDGVYAHSYPVDSNDQAALFAAVNSWDGYTATYPRGDDATSTVKLFCLADVAKSISAGGVDLDYDPARYYADEINGAKADIETNIPGYSCDSFVFPLGSHDSDSIDAVVAAGFIGARGVHGVGTVDWKIEDINPYRIIGLEINKKIGSASIEANVAAWLECAAWMGWIVYFFDHTSANYSLANWQAFIDAVSKCNVPVVQFRSALKDIKSKSTRVSDTRYTRTFNDPKLSPSQFSLASDSPGVGTGGIIPGIHDQPTPATDADGKPVLFTPNIGPYDGRTIEIITADNWTPARWTVREGAIVHLQGGGHVNLGNLATENEEITCKLSLSANINQFTPAGTNTVLKPVVQTQVFDGFNSGIGGSVLG